MSVRVMLGARFAAAFAGVALLAAMMTGHGAHSLDASLPTYRAVDALSGHLKSVGSDTLNNVMSLWQEGFGKEYPAANIAVEGKGSGTAPPALISGTSQFGPMSRTMKSGELDDLVAFLKSLPFEYPPSTTPNTVEHRVPPTPRKE